MLNKQFCTLDITKTQLEKHLAEVGYWGSPFLRKRNQFMLSPCGYLASEEQQQELDVIGKTIYASLGSVAERIFQLAKDTPRNREDQELLGITTRGSKKLLSPNETFDAEIPPIIKVDMVQDANGNYFVVEVDAYNPRGLGFNALLNSIALLDPSGNKVCKTIEALSQMLTKFNPNKKLFYLVSEHERYYAPSFTMLQMALLNLGIEMILVREAECQSPKEFIAKLKDEANGSLFMIPESLNNKALKDALLESYKSGEIKLFFPPKAYLGSKLLLPYLSELPGVNGFIPPTSLVSKNHGLNQIKLNKQLVLKAGQSSGMKGVLFSDLNKEDFSAQLKQEEGKKRASWVLQKHVPQESLSLKVFGEEGTTFQDYYLRVIAQFSADGLLGLDITGRPDRMVHGAPDCVMLPAVLH